MHFKNQFSLPCIIYSLETIDYHPSHEKLIANRWCKCNGEAFACACAWAGIRN